MNENPEEVTEEVVNEAPEAAESPVEDSEAIDKDVQEIMQIINERIESRAAAAETDVKEKPVECAACEKIAATPTSGSMTFECPADQALNMLTMVLQGKEVALHVEWTVVE